MGLSRQEYWRGPPFLPPGDLPDPGINPTSPVSPALAGGFFTTEPPRSRIIGKFITEEQMVWISAGWNSQWKIQKGVICPLHKYIEFSAGIKYHAQTGAFGNTIFKDSPSVSLPCENSPSVLTWAEHMWTCIRDMCAWLWPLEKSLHKCFMDYMHQWLETQGARTHFERFICPEWLPNLTDVIACCR